MAGNVPHPQEKDPFKLVQGIRELFQGRSNAVGVFTVTENTTTTTVNAINCGESSKVFITPTTANAAAEFGGGTIYVSSVESGAFTVTHANAGSTDRVYYYVCLG